ncbi:MAG: ligase-associated DNA damage response endonuclease PdeM [Rhodobacter sp.]|nr:ligase-associated DNA damage response endonuclease PdeM [Rhodobacter sp.]MCA3458474.1 ligase-associated DNA damage response endonuclease PdeM [Rhodobacter sp.]MCA3460488.1 ligase-associated DNA damage response endonuclease PdeM [Rhodobacter sp.]MCA3465099.1 ligase-associated DNA damage response endonuclease PdeM [Rhodobacter sp.]MCA3468858.1 ligase-associated DNA damage response endonuclease PdeM [Rhodobacter sp.]
MTAYAFTLAGQPLLALASGALYWPAQDLLCVSDLHLGKSERLARRGGTLLPPYETRETLTRLGGVLAATGARHVVCLGDSFDDGAAGGGLEEDDRLRLCALMAGRSWTWIAGNHDPAPLASGGTHLSEFATAGLTFRHIAVPGETGEVSGHFHPKARVAGRSRPCFLIDAARVILPAFGCYTGGLRASDPALAALLEPQALAVLTGPRALAIPMPR